jgi:hypothetical protein
MIIYKFVVAFSSGWILADTLRYYQERAWFGLVVSLLLGFGLLYVTFWVL